MATCSASVTVAAHGAWLPPLPRRVPAALSLVPRRHLARHHDSLVQLLLGVLLVVVTSSAEASGVYGGPTTSTSPRVQSAARLGWPSPTAPTESSSRPTLMCSADLQDL
jgi:hypothetical protein